MQKTFLRLSRGLKRKPTILWSPSKIKHCGAPKEITERSRGPQFWGTPTSRDPHLLQSANSPACPFNPCSNLKSHDHADPQVTNPGRKVSSSQQCGNQPEPANCTWLPIRACAKGQAPQRISHQKRTTPDSKLDCTMWAEADAPKVQA